jgi:hypothetical protein
MPASSGSSAFLQPEQAETALDNTAFVSPPKNVEPAAVQGSKQAPSPEECEKMKVTLSDFYNRWVEECQGADKLNSLTWAHYCPNVPATQEALSFIFNRGQQFVDGFQNDCCRAHNVQDYPRQVRPWLAETE